MKHIPKRLEQNYIYFCKHNSQPSSRATDEKRMAARSYNLFDKY
jgi:hypothetical protein